MMFPGDSADKKISVLSGGEQGRVLLGKVIAKSCNVLLLDEPTNHLDMESIQVMTEEIDAFPGGVLFVSHDEDLLNKLANKLIIFKDGGAKLFLGNYQEFLAKEGWGEAPVQKEKKSSGDRKEAKRKRAELVQERAKILKPLKKEMDQLEKSIMDDEASLESANEKVATMTLDSSDSGELFKEIGQIQIRIATSYERLDEVMAKHDQLAGSFEEQLEDLK
jgi:ATP-binding cassette subfamily F protein 3